MLEWRGGDRREGRSVSGEGEEKGDCQGEWRGVEGGVLPPFTFIGH